MSTYIYSYGFHLRIYICVYMCLCVCTYRDTSCISLHRSLPSNLD